MDFARRVLWIAGVYGLLVIVPILFLEGRIGRDYPPAITHPKYFYGFQCVALAWQVLYLFMAQDPARYRPPLPSPGYEGCSWKSTIRIEMLPKSKPS